MAFYQQDFLDAIYKTISDAVPEVAVFSTAISPNAPVPYVVFYLLGDIPAIYFGSKTDDFRIALVVDVYDKRDGSDGLVGGFHRLREVAEKIKTALHKKQITVSHANIVSGWCTRRGIARNENNNFNRISTEYLFLGSEA